MRDIERTRVRFERKARERETQREDFSSFKTGSVEFEEIPQEWRRDRRARRRRRSRKGVRLQRELEGRGLRERGREELRQLPRG